MNCPFCHTSIADAVFARSDNFLAVYNIAPIFPGHSLIIPRKHIESVMGLDEEKLTNTRHPKIFIGKLSAYPSEELYSALGRLRELALRGRDSELRELLNDFVPEATLSI